MLTKLSTDALRERVIHQDGFISARPPIYGAPMQSFNSASASPDRVCLSRRLAGAKGSRIAVEPPLERARDRTRC
jgi:hypothetical protein